MDLSTALPQLRHDLRFSEQVTPEQRIFIVKDPRNDRFYKVREAEHFIARQLDGRTSLEMVAGRAETQLSMAVSTEALRPFLDHLDRLGLLESPDCHGAKPRNTSVRGDVFALRWKAYDPDRLLNWLVHKGVVLLHPRLRDGLGRPYAIRIGPQHRKRRGDCA